ncbi:MAG: DNA polymerase [Clostridia bacterium]|nr:DNA polymerase [Clostridia bacterium]
MKSLSIDIETHSSADLGKSGVYRYSEAHDFEILLFAYSVDDGEIQVVDLANGEQIPEEIISAIFDSSVVKWAFNALFERICLSRHFGKLLPPDSFRCTMVWSAYMGLPLSLEGVGAVMGLEKQKLKEGKELIRYFSVPCKPTKANGGRTRNLPCHAPEKWSQFKEYNIRDVEVEKSVKEKLGRFPVPEEEWSNYILDQQINDRGIRLDMTFVKQAIRCDEQFRKTHIEKARNLTGLENPNSTQQLKEWLSDNGLTVDSLSKASVNDLLEDADGEIEEALQLRRELAKSSVKKYTAMEMAVCKDGRAHGLLQFYGANRTGRYAGRLIQVHNLPQNHLPDLAEVRELIKSGRFDAVEMLYDSVPIVLSELIRTAFIPQSGQSFLVADFSAIEARVIAWLAGERWRQEVFASHGKIYEASAAQMFHVPIEEITKGSPLRQKGKIAELALGYGGSVGALTAMGALAMGVQEEELLPLVKAWRSANPNITKLWWDVDKAAFTAVKDKTQVQLGRLIFSYESGLLFIRLPSGRRLSYVKPKIEINRYDREGVTYEGVGESKKWQRIESYGPKFVENIVQAIARDLLAEAMQRLNAEGFRIVLHVHDEVVAEDENPGELEKMCEIMGRVPKWADGLLLRADGFVCDFYKKD